MEHQNGRSLRDKAARSGAPQSRLEVDALLEKSDRSRVMTALRRWLDLEDEHKQLKQQAVHIRSALDDKVLGRLLEDRAVDVSQTLIRLGRELIELQAIQPADVGAKAYVLLQISTLCEEQTMLAGMCEQIRIDIDQLEIKIERPTSNRKKAG